MVVTIKKRYIYLFIILIFGCRPSENDSIEYSGIKSILTSDSIRRLPQFIERKYYDETPLAEVINLPNNTDSTVYFKLNSGKFIQIYAVGELVYNLANGQRPYYLLGDDIEISLCAIGHGNQKIDYAFSWADGVQDSGKVHFIKSGVEFYGKKTIVKDAESKYLAEMKIPISLLGKNLDPDNLRLIFNVAVGDNDDHFKQESKISLFSNSELVQKSVVMDGNLTLIKRNGDKKKSSITSVNKSMKIDGDFGEWSSLNAYSLDKIVFGEGDIFDKFDLSASIKCSWDKNNLYVFASVLDSKLHPEVFDKAKKKKTFLDFGYIEDSAGKIIWNMHVFDSKHAGGALKNQKIDTVLYLKKGLYKIFYSSDESHSYNNWDDVPPNTAFQGIVLYTYKSNDKHMYR